MFLKKYIIRRKRSSLRRQIRALQHLNQSQDPYQPITLFLEALKLTAPDRRTLETEPLLRGITPDEATRSIQQILFKKLFVKGGTYQFMMALYDPTSKIVLPFPPDTRRYMAGLGFNIAPVRSAIAWNALKARILIDGARRVAKVLLLVFKQSKAPPIIFANNSVFMRSDQFVKLDADRILGKWGFVKWFRRSGLSLGGRVILHRMQPPAEPVSLPDGIQLSETYFDPAVLPSRAGAFYSDLFIAVLKASFHFFTRKWWYAILLRSIADLSHARAVPQTAFARLYMLPLNHKIERYLWTYLAERQGSDFVILHYSHSCREFHPISPDYKILSPGYFISSWPMHIVWSEAHANGIRESGHDNAKYLINPPNFYVEKDTPFPDIKGPVVVIFDIGPPRTSIQATLGFGNPYLCLRTQVQFVRESVAAVRRAGATPVWKPKWIGASPRLIKHLQKELNVIQISDDMIPAIAAESATATISMPFTTTAAVSDVVGTPACYFDPTGSLEGFDHMAYSAPLVVGAKALDDWLQNVLKHPLIEEPSNEN